MWPRWTVTPVGGTSAILIVLFSLAHDGLGQVAADLLGVHVERGDELDVADVVVAELDVHQAGHRACRVGVLVVLTPWTSDAAQLPTPTMATRTEPMRVLLLADCRRGRGRGRSAGGSTVLDGGGARARSLVDQLVEPADLALDRLEAVLAAARGCSCRAARGCGPGRPRRPSRRSSSRRRRPSRMRSRTSASVCAKKAKWTPKPSSSYAAGPASASSSAKCSLPSAVSW